MCSVVCQPEQLQESRPSVLLSDQTKQHLENRSEVSCLLHRNNPSAWRDTSLARFGGISLYLSGILSKESGHYTRDAPGNVRTGSVSSSSRTSPPHPRPIESVRRSHMQPAHPPAARSSESEGNVHLPRYRRSVGGSRFW